MGLRGSNSIGQQNITIYLLYKFGLLAFNSVLCGVSIQQPPLRVWTFRWAPVFTRRPCTGSILTFRGSRYSHAMHGRTVRLCWVNPSGHHWPAIGRKVFVHYFRFVYFCSHTYLYTIMLIKYKHIPLTAPAGSAVPVFLRLCEQLQRPVPGGRHRWSLGDARFSDAHFARNACCPETRRNRVYDAFESGFRFRGQQIP